MTRGRDAPPLLLEAARRLEPLDATLARETYLEAFAAALSADRLVRGGDAREIAAAVLAADWERSTRATDLLLDGLALLAREGYVAGAPALKVALRAFRDEPLSEEDELRWLWLACRIARALADDGAWDELTARHLELARRAGAFSALPVALTDRVLVELFSGRIEVAMSLAAESDAVVEATGSHVTLRTAIVLANWRGRDAEAVALIEARRQDVLRRGEGLWLAANDWGGAIRYNGLGRYEDALALAGRLAEAARGLGPSILLLAELIEAATRSGHAEQAAGPLAQLAEIAHAAGTDWALGTHARAAAMVAGAKAAELVYREAVDRLARATSRATLARAHLLYGEWAPAPRASSRRRPRAAAGRVHDALGHGHGGVRRARPARAPSHRRDSTQAHRRDARRADSAGGAGRPPGRRRTDEPGDRRPAVSEPPHRGVALRQGIRKARRRLAQRAPRGAVRGRGSRRPRVAATGPRGGGFKPGTAAGAPASSVRLAVEPSVGSGRRLAGRPLGPRVCLPEAGQGPRQLSA